MASVELQKYVNEIGKFLQRNDGKVEYEMIDALHQASRIAMFTEKDEDYALRCTKKAKELLVTNIKQETAGSKDIWQIENYCAKTGEKVKQIDLFYELLKTESFYDLQSFLFYMEKNRQPEKRFYYPRRKTLKVVVDDLMQFEDNKFKFYGLSMPPRVGKSTTCIFFLNWIMLRRPNAHNAMCGHSGVLAKGFFKETLNFMTSEDYTFREMYEFWHPDTVLIREKSAEDYTITLDRPDRFPSLVCRGIDGTWTGAIDVSSDGYLYVDDLVKTREESMSMQRMENLFQSYQNEVLDRKQDQARELMVGTLWSVVDPLERTRVMFKDDSDYRFRRIPALSNNDMSNFNYEINGFSTKYYLDLRKRLNAPEWEAKYQQKPFVREGLLFPEEELRYFNGVIEDDGDCTSLAVIDPAFGGGDSLSMPICKDYGGNRKYIVDWVFNTGTQKVTVPLICNKIEQHLITRLQIEKNSGGQLLADKIKEELTKREIFYCKIELVFSPVKMSKEDKISGYSDFVKDNFIFLLPNDGKRYSDARHKRSKEYQKAMDEMVMYSPQGKNLHDDAPDSVVQLAMMFEKKRNGELEVVKNPFRY